MTKKILISIVLLAIGYFILGAITVWLSWFEKDTYLTLSAIIGSIASVSGLLAFTTNKIERDDIERVGVEYFKKVVESADELKLKEEELLTKEKALTVKEKEIKELDIKKQEMEYLVRKASMSLFLKDQLERTELRIVELVQENKEFTKLLQQRLTIVDQLKEVDGEIESSPKVELINEIIMTTRHALAQQPPKKKLETPLDFVLAVGEEIVKILFLRFK